MSLSVGGTRGKIAEINVVPLIDILLVLIIVFMVISPATAKGHEALIPQSSDGGQRPGDPVIVQLFADGTLKINEELQTWDSLGGRMEEIFQRRADRVAFVRSQNTVLFSQVARAIDVIRSHGVEKVGLITARIAAAE